MLGEDAADAAAEMIGKPFDMEPDQEAARQAVDAPEPAEAVRDVNGACVHCWVVDGHAPDCVWMPLA